MDDRVPELIWIALLMHALGIREGVAVAAGIAKAASNCHEAPRRAFAAASDFAGLSNDQKRCMQLALKKEGTLEKARQGLAVLISHYPGFPLAFLGSQDGSNQDCSESTLCNLRRAIQDISDRQGDAGIFAQATVVYIYFINDMLKVSPGSALANFTEIERYPKTEESRRVASSVRSAVTGLIKWDIPPNWRNAFWNRGRTLGPCEVN